MFAAFLLTGGTLGDRYGRRRVFLVGLSLFTAGSALCALSGSLGVLIGGRVVQGLGGALLMPGTMAIIRHVFTDDVERARAIGLWSGVSGRGSRSGRSSAGRWSTRSGGRASSGSTCRSASRASRWVRCSCRSSPNGAKPSGRGQDCELKA
ncbi:MFS transporter [Yinghuangia aomiensis]